jgi:AraC-like DNA-binding protein
MKTLIVSQSEISRLLPMAECIEAMAEALRAVARGDAVLPLRQVVPLPHHLATRSVPTAELLTEWMGCAVDARHPSYAAVAGTPAYVLLAGVPVCDTLGLVGLSWPEGKVTGVLRPDPFEYYTALKRVRERVHANLGGITLREAAAAAGLVPKSFSRFFREKVGFTFTEWLAAYRVELTARLLREGDYPVGHIAEAVGFVNYRTCERWFLRCTGLTPSEFRRRVKPR